MLADIVAAIKAAKREMEEQVNRFVYLLVEYEDAPGEAVRAIDKMKVTGFRMDADVIYVIIEYMSGDIDEMSLTEFARRACATREAAQCWKGKM